MDDLLRLGKGGIVSDQQRFVKRTRVCGCFPKPVLAASNLFM
jgi:hypothetical protein